MCSQLEGLVDKQYSSTDETNLLLSSLQQEIKRKDAEIQSKNIQIQHQATKIEALTADVVKLQMHHDPTLQKTALLSRQVNN